MRSFFNVTTCHDSTLLVDRATGTLTSGRHGQPNTDYGQIYLYISPDKPTTGFFLTDDDTTLSLPPRHGNSGILAIGIAGDTASTIAFYDPKTSRWLCATPPTPPHSGRLHLDREHVREFERFTVQQCLPIGVPDGVSRKATRIDALRAQPFTVNLLRGATPNDAAVLEAIAHFTTPETLAELAHSLLRSPTDAAILSQVFQGDLMAQHGLPALARWMAARDAPSSVATPAPRGGPLSFLWRSQKRPAEPASPSTPPPAVLAESLDCLDKLGWRGEYVSLPHSLTALARQSVSPRKDLCIIATARNEGPYLLEWIAYHRALGVQHFFLYTNDNNDGSDILLAALHRARIITWIDNKVASGGNAQHKAYGHALGILPETLDYRWALIIDLDEYLVINPQVFKSAIDFIDWHDGTGADGIALNWIFHGPTGQTHWRDDFIGRRFPNELGGADQHVKSFCKPRMFIHSHPHFPYAWRNAAFRLHAADGGRHKSKLGDVELGFSAAPSANFAWINHYFYKSAEEFLWKFSRNRGNYAMVSDAHASGLGANFIHAFMRDFDSGTPERISLEQSAPGFAAEHELLASQPEIADALAHVKRIYAERIKTIVPLFLKAPGMIEAADVGRALMAKLGL